MHVVDGMHWGPPVHALPRLSAAVATIFEGPILPLVWTALLQSGGKQLYPFTEKTSSHTCY